MTPSEKVEKFYKDLTKAVWNVPAHNFLAAWKSKRHPAAVLTDLNYADGISQLSIHMGQAQELLSRVEAECAKVGLRLNAKKTEVITCNIQADNQPLTTTGGTALKEIRSCVQQLILDPDENLRALDGCYTRMLHVVLNISKCAHVTNENLYAGIFRVSNKIAERKGEWDLQDTDKDTRSCKPVNCCNGSQHMGTGHKDVPQ